MATRKSPSDAAAKWVTRVQSSAQYYQQGVANPSVDWAGPAVAASSKRDAGLQRAMADGRIDAGIQRVGTNKWRANTLAKGVTNWTTNTPKSAPAYQAGIQRTYGYYGNADSAVAGMPTDTVAQRIAKAGVFLQSVSDQAQADKARNG